MKVVESKMRHKFEIFQMNLNFMRVYVASIFICVGISGSGIFIDEVRAQEVIDIFENQQDMPIKAIEIGSDRKQHNGQSLAGDDIRIEGVTSGRIAPKGSIRLNFQRGASGIFVPVRIRQHDVYFLLDTGASYTTLTPDFARSISVLPPANGPMISVMTANGYTQSAIGLVSGFNLGGVQHDNISFSVCASCGGGRIDGKPVVGLLGLNILRRYRVSVDDSNGSVELTPTSQWENRASDIELWLDMQVQVGMEAATRQPSLSISGTLINQAPRSIRDIELVYLCEFKGELKEVGRGKVARLQVREQKIIQARFEKIGLECMNLGVKLESARW